MTHAPDADRLKGVLDTNIYIAAFEFPRGWNAVLWQAARTGRYRLIVSPPIIRETARGLRSDFGWEDERVEQLVRIIAEVATVVMPRDTVRAVKADPDDDRVLECAAEGKADLIVSNDHHLLDLESWSGISIVAAVDFRRTLGLK
jgi:putative PIN family toxin of toxin-antitoxin system